MPKPSRLYRTYSALGQRIDGTPEKVSIMETDLPDTLLLYVGESPKPGGEILIPRGAWGALTDKIGQFSYSDFTWVDPSAGDSE